MKLLKPIGLATAALSLMAVPHMGLAQGDDHTPVVYALKIVATVDATQQWEKNDPEYPGEQWSKAKGKQRYEILTELRSDGRLEVRNLLHPDLETRLEAKVIFLARTVARQMRAEGKEVRLPETEAEQAELNEQMYREMRACKGEAGCSNEVSQRYSALFAAMQYPEAMEEDTVPGRFMYFLPFDGCRESSRVQMALAIDGVRYNKNERDLVEFSERRSADTVDASDGMTLCEHFTVVVDTEDEENGLYVENVFVPRPVGITEYTENGHTTREEQSQPMPPAALDWMTETLRHAPLSGKASATLPLPMSLNGNSTWLGLWKGEADVEMEWSFIAVEEPGEPVQP